MPKKIFIQELEGTRKRGRPRKRRKEEVERDLDAGFLSWFPCVFKANAEMVPKSKLPLHASHVSLPM